MAERINLMRLFYSTGLFALEAIFLSIHQLFEKSYKFWVVLSVPHLIDNYAKNVMSGVELYVRTHITEPPCYQKETFMIKSFWLYLWV